MQTARILVALFNGLFGVPVKQAPEHKPGYAIPYEKPTTQIVIKVGNMMSLPVDAVVDIATSNLQAGDGIITENKDPKTGEQLVPAQGDCSGSILRQWRMLQRAGKEPLNYNGQLPVGESIITSSGTIAKQQAKTIRYVVATVGPQGPKSDDRKNKQLYNAYFNSLLLASNHTKKAGKMLHGIDPALSASLCKKPIETIAFPAISTGIYNYPPQDAAAQTVHACLDFIRAHPHALKKIYLVFLSKNDWAYKALEQFLQEYTRLVQDPYVDSIVIEK